MPRGVEARRADHEGDTRAFDRRADSRAGASGSVKSMATSAFASALRAIRRDHHGHGAGLGDLAGVPAERRARRRRERAGQDEVSATRGSRERGSGPSRPLTPSTATFVMSAAHPAEELLARPRARSARADCAACRPRAAKSRTCAAVLSARTSGPPASRRRRGRTGRRSAPPRTGLMPFSRSRNTRPDCVPAGILMLAWPSSVGTSIAAAERRRHEADRHLAGQVRAVALEDRMLADDDLDIQVAGRPAIAARFALAGEPDAVAVVDAGRHLDREPLACAHAAVAARTWRQGSLMIEPRPLQRGQVCCTAKNALAASGPDRCPGRCRRSPGEWPVRGAASRRTRCIR